MGFAKGCVCCGPDDGAGGAGKFLGRAEMVIVVEIVSWRSVGVYTLGHEQGVGAPGAAGMPAVASSGDTIPILNPSAYGPAFGA